MDLQQVLQNPMTQQIIRALLNKYIGGQAGAASGGQAGIDLGGILGGMLGKSGGDGASSSGSGGIDLGKILGGALGSGGSGGLLGQLASGGLGDQLKSWLGNGANHPVDAQQLTAALGPDTVKEIAAETGASPEQVSETISQVLPAMVDEASPAGDLDPQALQATLSKLLGS